VQVLASVDVHTPRVPVLSNVTATPFPPDPQAIRELLGRQLVEPVRWGLTFSPGEGGFGELGGESPTACVCSFFGGGVLLFSCQTLKLSLSVRWSDSDSSRRLLGRQLVGLVRWHLPLDSGRMSQVCCTDRNKWVYNHTGKYYGYLYALGCWWRCRSPLRKASLYLQGGASLGVQEPLAVACHSVT
jgi:hypothetical protein